MQRFPLRRLSRVLPVLALAACEGAWTAATSDAGTQDAGAPDSGTRRPVTRGTRYCELLLAFVESGGIRVEVWGTQGLNECPMEAWEAVDDAQVRMQTGASFVLRNGPRYWLADRTLAEIPDREPMLFGELRMQQLASIMLPPGTMASTPYTERTILRDTSLELDAGREVYELLAPDGSIYVMQSYAQIVDPELEESDLATLGARLELPEGWAYRARTLDALLVVSTPGMATVLQDELQNSYSLYVEGSP